MHRTLAAALACAALSGVSAGAEEIADCLKVENDLDRLACYDRVSGRTPATTTEPPAADKGAWIVQTEKSAMTDQTDVFATVFSEEVVNCGWNDGDRIQLTLRCMENTTSMIFGTGCHMTSSEYNNYGDVDLRVDEQQARTVGFQESTNNRSLGLWNGGRSIPEIKRLFGGKKLLARMTPFSENAFTATFDISGVEEAVKSLREACGW
jgi:type VI secretion system protein VasI